MKNVMKIRIAVSALLLTIGAISYGQAVPAGGANTPISSIGSSPYLPTLDGVLHYALSASEAIQYGYYGNGVVTSSTILSGDVSYTGKSELHPFNLLASGGVILANQQTQGTTGYVNATISQGYITRAWVFNISDSISFLPQSPTLGLSGIPGVGDLGSLPLQGPVEGPAGGVLSNSGNRIANYISGSAERQIGHATSISGSGSWSVLHFLNNSASNEGLDNSMVSGTVAVNRRLDARSSVSLNAVYSTFTYSGGGAGPSQPDIESRGINVSYQRLLSRTLSVDLSAGPQWISSSNSTLVPSSLNAAASASLRYSQGLMSASVGYSHGVNAGSGVLAGDISDSFFASAGRTYGRNWVFSSSAAYTRSAGLALLPTGSPLVPVNEVYNTVFGGFQVTRALSTHFSAYLSYSAQNQSSNYSAGGQNALNGTSQTFAIGVTFTPRSTRLGQF
jgi:hypothetical protein